MKNQRLRFETLETKDLMTGDLFAAGTALDEPTNANVNEWAANDQRDVAEFNPSLEFNVSNGDSAGFIERTPHQVIIHGSNSADMATVQEINVGNGLQ